MGIQEVNREMRERIWRPAPEIYQETWQEKAGKEGDLRRMKMQAEIVQLQITRFGLVEMFFENPFGSRTFLRQITDFRCYAARLNALHELRVTGNAWETIPLAVRESELVQQIPELFFISLVREARFAQMVELGLKIGDHVQTDLDNDDGVWPRWLTPKDGTCRYSGDLIEWSIGGMPMSPVSGQPIPWPDHRGPISGPMKVEAWANTGPLMGGRKRVNFP